MLEDEDIKPIAEKLYQFSKQNIEQIKQIYVKENHTIPMGFTDEDVDVTAPRLFADTYFWPFFNIKWI
ncbi:DUF3231 family protein [Evansella vedderi]|uniref:DUF3231 family protein n=1 Tax=Evansella vedderi TaxID=38282 RepID=UPI00352290E7